MYIDLIVLVVLLVFVIIYSKRFQTYFWGFGMIDILFRILNIIKGYIPSIKTRALINQYIPGSIPDVVNKYVKGVANTAIIFIYVVIMAIFLYLVVKAFIRRKRI